MKAYPRSDRVGALVKELLSDLLTKKIRDPRLSMVTITGVDMTRDLRFARIYFIRSGLESEQQKKEVLEGFHRAMGFIKRSLADRLGLRYMPDIQFRYDESFDHGQRIDSILQSMKADDAGISEIS